MDVSAHAFPHDLSEIEAEKCSPEVAALTALIQHRAGIEIDWRPGFFPKAVERLALPELLDFASFVGLYAVSGYHSPELYGIGPKNARRVLECSAPMLLEWPDKFLRELELRGLKSQSSARKTENLEQLIGRSLTLLLNRSELLAAEALIIKAIRMFAARKFAYAPRRMLKRAAPGTVQPWMNPEETATALQTSPRKVREFIAAGRLENRKDRADESHVLWISRQDVMKLSQRRAAEARDCLSLDEGFAELGVYRGAGETIVCAGLLNPKEGSLIWSRRRLIERRELRKLVRLIKASVTRERNVDVSVSFKGVLAAYRLSAGELLKRVVTKDLRPCHWKREAGIYGLTFRSSNVAANATRTGLVPRRHADPHGRSRGKITGRNVHRNAAIYS
jgi:hypothetical protein